MAGMMDILGSLLDGGIKQSTAGRVEHSLGEGGVGGPAGMLAELLGGGSAPGGAAGAMAGGGQGSIGDLIGSVLGNKSNQSIGGLGALAGAILGGGGGSAKGAIGGGALALLGSLALQAFRNAGKQPQGSQALDSASSLAAGLRAPENDYERQQVQSVSELVVKAMLNAAKADGRVDEAEMDRITGNLEKDGITAEEREMVTAELRRPIDTDSVVAGVTDPQVGAQVYAASLLAIDLNTEAEKRYMADLARRLQLDDDVVRSLHSALGAAA